VVVDDLAFVQVDAVVRPATGTLEPTSPSLRRLEQVGGPTFFNQLRVTQELGVGAAVVTGGGELAAELVIHAIIRTSEEAVSRLGVRRALTSTLQRALDWRLARIALPPIGTGPGNLAIEAVAQLTVDVLSTHMADAAYPSEVSIVVETEADREVFDALLRHAR
ncbi:MAG: macro domain-containing protein, partial [Sciscionella sp.]